MANGPQVLCIAGIDSTALAGLDMDLRTVRKLGCTPVSLSTAETEQGRTVPGSICVRDASTVAAELSACLKASPIAAIKIGMLGTRAMVKALTEVLVFFEGPVVLDPVLSSSRGLTLLEADALLELEALAKICALVTPNLPEFEALGSDEWRRRIGVPVLLKGGHAQGSLLEDRLLWPDGRSHVLRHPRLELKNSRGTGCALASAIACKLALGLDLERAVCEGIESLQATFREQAVP